MIEEIYVNNKKTKNSKWVIPLPKILQILNVKFQGLEKTMFCFWSHERNKVAFQEICFCIHMYCREKFTKHDMKKIYTLIPHIYSISYIPAINFRDKSKNLILNVINLEDLILKKRKIFIKKKLKSRKKKFKILLENEVLRQHQDFITWNNNWIRYNNVRTKEKFHPDFKLNKDFQVNKVIIESNYFLKKKILRKNKVFQKDDKLRFYFLKEKSCENMNFRNFSFQFFKKKNSYFSSFFTNKIFFSIELRNKIIKNINPILRHLSPSTLIKNQGKKNSKQFLEILNVPLKKKKIKDLIYIIDLMQSILISFRKSSISYELLIKSLMKNNKRKINLKQTIKYVELLCIFFPEFYQIKKTIKMKIIRYGDTGNIFQIKKKIRTKINKLKKHFNKFL